jgi:hypothetical protein
MRISSPTRAAIATAVCLIGGLAAAPSALCKDPLSVTAASIGFGGKYKAGFWNPVRLSLKAGPQGAAGQLELVIPDGDHVPVIFADEQRGQINLKPDAQITLVLYAKTGPIAGSVTVRLRSDQGAIWSQDLASLLTPALASTRELVVGIGPSVGLADVESALKRRADLAVVTAQVESTAELPDRWWGYEGVDAIVFATGDQTLLDAVSPAQREALLQWVRLGGRIILCVGAGGQRVLASDSPWAELAPGELADVAPLRDGTGLQTFTSVELPFEHAAFQRSRPQATRLLVAEGKVLVEEGGAISANRPLIVHAPHALGEVIFVGLDLEHPALAAWRGRPQLLARLLQSEKDQREQTDRESRRSVTHLGYEDLVGQLRAALDQFRGVTIVNFTTVSILTIIYLLLVGPGDYLLLSRFGWPRQWTWFTFPLIAAGLGAAAWIVAGQSHGQRVRVNQAEVVDLDFDRGVVRGTVWSHIYSPTTSHYDAALEIDLPGELMGKPTGWLVWQGLPGESLGGLGSSQVQLTATEPYRVSTPSSQPALSGLPVPVASSKSLAARWWAKAKVEGEANLSVNQFGVLTGDFPFPLPVKLTDCLVVHGEKLYRLDKLSPGQVVHMEDFTPLNLEARLTQRTVVLSKDVSTPWDKASIDVPRIVLMMMFHDAARGSSYTGLTNRYQPYIDLTRHVRLGRAVLVGRAEQSISRLSSNEHPLAEGTDEQTWTWYRVVLPVGTESPSSSPP